MNIFDVLLTGVGLSMDAAAVAATNGMNEPKMRPAKMLLTAFLYGAAQGIMPLIGYFAGVLLAGVIASIAPYVALVLLTVIGGKMAAESIAAMVRARRLRLSAVPPKESGSRQSEKQSEEQTASRAARKPIGAGTLLMQAFATSIDALAVGISMSALESAGDLTVNVYLACALIALCTFAIGLVAVTVGKRFGSLLSDKAGLVGGLILIAIGIKIFIEGVLL